MWLYKTTALAIFVLQHCVYKMSARKFTAGLCILWQCFHLSSCSIAYMKYSKLKAINWGLPLAGHKLNVTPIATSRVTNHIKCMVHCAKTEGCVATNLGPAQAGQHECEMLETTRYSILNSKFTAKAGWTYVGPKVMVISLLTDRTICSICFIE